MRKWKCREPPSNPRGLLEGDKPWLGRPRRWVLDKYGEEGGGGGLTGLAVLQDGSLRGGGDSQSRRRPSGLAWVGGGFSRDLGGNFPADLQAKSLHITRNPVRRLVCFTSSPSQIHCTPGLSHPPRRYPGSSVRPGCWDTAPINNCKLLGL